MVMNMEEVMTVVGLDITDLHKQFVSAVAAAVAVENVVGMSRVWASHSPHPQERRRHRRPQQYHCRVVVVVVAKKLLG